MKEKRREEKYYTLANFLSFKLFIALLSLILFFSISCKSNEEPTETPPAEPTEPPKPPTPTTKHELEGTWIGYDTNHHNSKVELKIDSDGNVTLTPQPAIDYDNSLYPYTYKGKVETNAIVYPYAVKISNLMIDYMDKETKEKRIGNPTDETMYLLSKISDESVLKVIRENISNMEVKIDTKETKNNDYILVIILAALFILLLVVAYICFKK